ncbi:hypothetical protein ACFFX0_08095 [Citricoccus parietis]|uniref:Secreted protein n=1 Tax=Citricoccus parietis TaxID=592307 RepID=A0ABV5FWU0_9MICC
MMASPSPVRTAPVPVPIPLISWVSTMSTPGASVTREPWSRPASSRFGPAAQSTWIPSWLCCRASPRGTPPVAGSAGPWSCAATMSWISSKISRPTPPARMAAARNPEATIRR